VVAAREDRLRSIAEAWELHEAINGSALVIIEGSGHIMPMEAPAEFARAVLSWWATL